MKYCIVISAHPCLPAASYALRFCQALESSPHELTRIFFHSEGVLNSDINHQSADQWGRLKSQERFICAASVDRFFCDQEHPKNNIHQGFIIAGLGQLVAAETICNRVITFGQAC